MRLTKKNNGTGSWTQLGDKYLPAHNVKHKECVNKLGQLEDIEERIGIDLRDLFNALTGTIYVNTILGIYELEGCMCCVDRKKRALRCYSDDQGKFLPFNTYGTYWSANREDVVKWRKENGWE